MTITLQKNNFKALQKFKIQKSLNGLFVGLGLFLSIVTPTSAELISSNSTDKSKIVGYAPYMQSIGAELLTEIKDPTSASNNAYFPWTYADNSTVKKPTVGSIIHIPDIFCSIPNPQHESAKAIPEIAKYLPNFSFIDKDLDECASGISSTMNVEWYMLDNLPTWSENLTWEELNPTLIDRQYIISVGTDTAKTYQQKHVFPPFEALPLNLNTLDALIVPEAALNKRIGFRLVPKSKTGLPREGSPIKVWDLDKYFAQNPPSSPTELLDDNPGFILGDNPVGDDNSTAGGVVELGRSPYVRSIGAQLASSGENVGWYRDDKKVLLYASGQLVSGAYTYRIKTEGAVLYIPDLFCTYRNGDIVDLNNIPSSEYSPTVPEKFPYYRPLFWIADADEDSCKVDADQIQWVITEPASAEWDAFQAKLAAIDDPEVRQSVDNWREAQDIWNKVTEWKDVKVIDDNLSDRVILPGSNSAPQYNFDGLGGNFLTAIRVPQSVVDSFTAVGFIYTPKTASGLPDVGRQIKVPNAMSRIWGQLPPSRPQSLADAQSTTAINQNDSGDGTFLGFYPALRMMVIGDFEDTIPLPSEDDTNTFSSVNLQCLLDPNKIPAQDCVMPPISYQSARSSARALNDKNIPTKEVTVQNTSLSGYIGMGEVLTVTYEFLPADDDRPEGKKNNSVYEFRPFGEAREIIGPLSPFAGSKRNVGLNSFQLPPLTAEQAGQIMEVAVQARDGLYQLNNIDIAETTDLESYQPPAVKNVQIIPENEQITVGTKLQGRYEFVPAQSSEVGNDASIYSWVAANPFSDVAITESGKVSDYMVTENDLGQTITLKVKAKDTKERLGNEEMATLEILSPIPAISNLRITSSDENFTYNYTAVLTANYDFDSGIVNDSTDLSEYAWFVDDELIVAQTKTFNLSGNELGKTIRFTIKPINKLKREGVVQDAEYILLETPPTIKNLKIILEEENFEPSYYGILKATYDFVPGVSSNSRDKSIYEWQGGANESKSVSYAFNSNDIGRTLTFKVTPKDGAGLTGAPQYAEYTMLKPPAVENLVINQNVVSLTAPYQVTLSGQYDYIPSTSSKPDNNSTFTWSGLSTNIEGVTKNGQIEPINLAPTDAGKLITLTVTPRDDNLLVGEPQSKTLATPDTITLPQIDNLTIQNTNTTNGVNIFAGDTVRAVYDFTPSSVSTVDASEFIWKVGQKQIAGKLQEQNTLTYTTTLEDAGQVIYLDMTAFDGLGNKGNTASAQTNSVVITPPQIDNLKISVLSETLSPWNVFVAGSYTYTMGKSANPLNDSTYSWTGITSPILNQPTSGEGPVFIPAISISKEDAGKVLTLTVNPKDRAGIVGDGKSTTYTIPDVPVLPPRVSNLTITDMAGQTPTLLVEGNTLRGNYIFTAGSKSDLDRSRFIWKAKSGETSGSVNEISKPTYTIKTSDTGAVIQLTVQAYDGADISGNTEVATTSVKVVKKPEISDVNIGFKETGSLDIEGTYKFNPGVSDNPVDASQYSWIVGGQVVSQGVVKTSGQLTGTEGLKVVQSYVGKIIQLKVLPRDQTGVVGLEQVSNTLTYYPPEVSGAFISGLAKEGVSLKAGYDFLGKSNNVDQSLATWSKNGVVDKTLPTSDVYPLALADVGKTIGLTVNAKDGNGIVGNSANAQDIGPVQPLYRPAYVAGVTILYGQDRSVVVSGNDFTGTYATFNEGSVPGNKSTYQWIVAGTVRSSGDVGPNKTIPKYVSSDADIGKTITLTVTARDGNSTPGNQASDSTLPVIQPPRVANPSIYYAGLSANDLRVGMSLGGTYQWSTGRAGASDASVVRWYVGNVMKLEQVVPSQGYVPAFEVKSEYANQVIKLEVTAADTLRTPGGNTVSIQTITVPPNVPIVQNVKISANFTVSALITGEYTFIPGSGTNIADRSEYKWMANRTTTLQSGVLNGTNKVDGVNAYTVKTADVGKTLELMITPKDSGGNSGTGVYSSNSYVYIAPTISNVSISNPSTTVDSALTVKYTFTGGSNGVSKSLANWYVNGVLNTQQLITKSFTISSNMVGKSITLTATAVDNNSIQGNTVNSTNSINKVTEVLPRYNLDYWLMDAQGPGQFISITQSIAFANLGWPASSAASQVKYEWMVGNTTVASGTLIRNNNTGYGVGAGINLSKYRGQTVCIYLTGITPSGSVGPREQAWCRTVP